MRISSPLQHLHLIREKICLRGYQSFDSQDIMDELGQLQHLLGEFNRDMLAVYDLINNREQNYKKQKAAWLMQKVRLVSVEQRLKQV